MNSHAINPGDTRSTPSATARTAGHDHVPIVAGWAPIAVPVEGVATLRHRHGQEAVFDRPAGRPLDPEGLSAAHAEALRRVLRRLARRGITLRRLVPEDVIAVGDVVVLRGTTRPERAPGAMPRVAAWKRMHTLAADLPGIHGPRWRRARRSRSAPPPDVGSRRGIPAAGASTTRIGTGLARPRRAGSARWLVGGLAVGAAATIATSTRFASDRAADPVTTRTTRDAPVVLDHDGSRYGVGDPGDVVAVGDWDGDGLATPAVVRASNGAVYRWDAWPADGPGSPGVPVSTDDGPRPAGGRRPVVVGCDRHGSRATVLRLDSTRVHAGRAECLAWEAP
jgi:hypothetical protein